MNPKKIALIHYWLITRRGGEKVLENILEIFPSSDVFTLFYKQGISEEIETKTRKIFSSSLNRLPFIHKYYRNLFFLYPFFLQEFDLTEYDLVISSHSGPAHQVITSPESLHICYCHSPTRYIWDMYKLYTSQMSVIKKMFFKSIAPFLRVEEYTSAQRVDYFIANSSYVQKRIKKFYNRESIIIHPPVEIKRFYYKPPENYYFILSELVPYKGIEIAIHAFNQMKKKLLVAGVGPQLSYLKKIAGKNIEFLGKVSQQEIPEYYARCKAFIFPGVEDFGITPVEANASGKVVIALAKGGVLDSQTPKTSVMFSSPTPQSLIEAIKEFEKKEEKFSPEEIINNSKRFSSETFRKKFYDFVIKKYAETT